MNDIWVCSTCRSINRQRSERCYHCGATQAEAMPTEGPALRVVTAVAERVARPYRPAWPLALVASVLILVVAALGVFIVVELADAIAVLKAEAASLVADPEGYDPAAADRALALSSIEVLRLGLLAVAVTAFGAWLSRVVSNIPTLGGGDPSTTPLRAFVYSLIPLVNLVKVPGIVQDALYRVEPKAGGLFMVVLAWFGLVGSWFVERVGSWMITSRMVGALLDAASPEDALAAIVAAFDQAYLLGLATSLMVAGGAVILVIVMLRIELRSAARDREIRGAVLA
jgi:Domain of unknown function (DUF4328)